MKKWYAFDIGPNGVISTGGGCISQPFDSRKAAEDWATTRFPKSQASQIGIVELIAVAERAAPPITITDIHPTFAVEKAA